MASFPQYSALTPMAQNAMDLIVQIFPTHLKRTPPLPEPKQQARKRIYLNPGHSDTFPGARGLVDDIKEEVQNMLAANVMAEILRGEGHDVVIYRRDDDNLVELGNHAAGCDLALSIHHNAFDHKDRYTSFYGAKAVSEKSQALGEKICEAVARELGIANAGVKPSNFTVPNTFAKVAPDVPSGLVELYFIDAYASPKLVDERTTNAAKAAASGVLAYFAERAKVRI